MKQLTQDEESEILMPNPNLGPSLCEQQQPRQASQRKQPWKLSSRLPRQLSKEKEIAKERKGKSPALGMTSCLWNPWCLLCSGSLI